MARFFNVITQLWQGQFITRKEFEERMRITQEQIDEKVAALNEAVGTLSTEVDAADGHVADLESEIVALKEQQASGAEIDLSGLDKIVANLRGASERLKSATGSLQDAVPPQPVADDGVTSAPPPDGTSTTDETDAAATVEAAPHARDETGATASGE